MTITETSLMEALHLEAVEEQPVQPRYAAHRMLAARNGDLVQRMLLVRARNEGEAHRRSESHEGPALSDD